MRERQARLEQVAAETAKQSETVRADAVIDFVEKLLITTAPELLLQGHQRSVRDLLEAADELASSALSHAPAAELHLRGLMSVLYLGDGPSLLDSAASYQQVKRINELLQQVPDDKLPVPRDALRIGTTRSLLWVGQSERGLAELQALKDEFRQRTPAASEYIAWCLAVEGSWRLFQGDAAKAEAALAEALRLVPSDAPPEIVCFIRGYLAHTLSDRGAWTEAESVAREGLLPAEKITRESAPLHIYMVSELASALCHQKRFAEAEALIERERRSLNASNCPPRVLLALQKRAAEVIARAGRGREALPILMSVATNSLGTSDDCADAACVAIGSGDLESYRRLCAVGLARFAAGAEGINALRISEMLLAAPQDEVINQVVDDLVERVESSRDFTKEFGTGLRVAYIPKGTSGGSRRGAN